MRGLEGLKKDSGKLRMDLIPVDALREIARVLTFGAEKYTTRDLTKDDVTGIITGICDCQKLQLPAIQSVPSITAQGSADSATRKNFEQTIQSTRSVKELMPDNGTVRTKIESSSTIRDGGLNPITKKSAESDLGNPSSTYLDLLSKMNSESSKNKGVAVESVEDLPIGPASTSTIVTQLDNSEDFSVYGVTKPLASWETAQRELKRHSAICAVRKVGICQGENNSVQITGDRNWEKGIKYSRVYGALLRHVTSFWAGESVDPETGISHLAHAGCCLMFLLAFEQRGMNDFDDRPDAVPRGNV